MTNKYGPYYLALILISLSLTTALALRLDTLNLFGQRLDPNTPELLERQGFIVRYMDMIKPYQLQKIQANNLVLGSSAASRIPTQHPYWGEGTTYNAALPMMRMEEAYFYLQHAHAITPIKKVVLDINHGQFVARPRSGFSRKRFVIGDDENKNPAFYLQRFLDRLKLTFNIRTIGKLISDDNTSNELILWSDGTWDYRQQPSQDLMFKRTLKRIKNINQASKNPQNMTYRYFEKILQYCYDNNIQLDIVMFPIHSEILYAALDSANIEEQKIWQKNVVHTIFDVADKNNRQPFTLWDFQGFYDYQSHPLTEKISQKQQGWFWDGLHFNKGMGELILDSLKAMHSGNPITSGLIAKRLTPNNIEQHIERERKERLNYQKTRKPLTKKHHQL